MFAKEKHTHQTTISAYTLNVDVAVDNKRGEVLFLRVHYFASYYANAFSGEKMFQIRTTQYILLSLSLFLFSTLIQACI